MSHQIVYLSYHESESLVDRIAERCKNFDYDMSDTEKASMSNLLSDIGVTAKDVIDVSNLADNYAINAEIVRPEDYEHYNMRQVKQDSLFSWVESDQRCYCLSW